MKNNINENHKKVIIIGLDGATYDLLMPWIKEGLLPNISYMMNKGFYCELLSTIPMFTPTAWSTFMTGKNPGKHGILGFFEKNKNSYSTSLINPSKKRGKVLWDVLSENGKKAIIINVPTTYPPRKINGILISGMLTPPNKKNFIYPPFLLDEINKIVKGYKIYPYINYSERNEDIFISEIFSVTEIQATTAEYLMLKYSWDIFIVVFCGGDQLQHALWKYIDPTHKNFIKEKESIYINILFEYYKKIDDIIGNLFQKSGTNTIKIIISDHGFGALYKFFHINQWLIKNKFMKFKGNPYTLFKYLFYKSGITPDNLYKFLLKTRLGNIRFKMGRKKVHNLISKIFLSFSDIDWNRTVAYSLGAMGQIFLNVKDREPMGLIKSKNYNECRQKIANLLYRLKDPDTSMQIINKIYFREDIYHGKYINEMPDIIIIPHKGYIGFEEYEFASNNILTVPKGISGTHRRKGIFMALNHDIKGGIKLSKKIKIEDLAPSVYSILNVPIPDDVDGSPISEIISY